MIDNIILRISFSADKSFEIYVRFFFFFFNTCFSTSHLRLSVLKTHHTRFLILKCLNNFRKKIRLYVVFYKKNSFSANNLNGKILFLVTRIKCIINPIVCNFLKYIFVRNWIGSEAIMNIDKIWTSEKWRKLGIVASCGTGRYSIRVQKPLLPLFSFNVLFRWPMNAISGTRFLAA